MGGGAVVAYTKLIESDSNDTDLLARTYGSRGFTLGGLGRFEETMADKTVVIELVRVAVRQQLQRLSHSAMSGAPISGE